MTRGSFTSLADALLRATENAELKRELEALVAAHVRGGVKERRKRFDRMRKALRPAVVRRDGKRCRWCGTTDNLTIDHILPLSEGGDNTIGNLRILCAPCNSGRAASEAPS